MSNPMEPKTSSSEQDLTHPRNNESSLLELQRLGRINQAGSPRKQPYIMLIQETKMPDEEVMNRSSLFSKNSVGKAISLKGDSGGIATFCMSNKFNIRSAKENTHWLLIEMPNKSNQDSIFICNVYGPTHYKDKLEFWDSLLSLNLDLQGKDIMIAGDFNTMKTSMEKKRRINH